MSNGCDDDESILFSLFSGNSTTSEWYLTTSNTWGMPWNRTQRGFMIDFSSLIDVLVSILALLPASLWLLTDSAGFCCGCCSWNTLLISPCTGPQGANATDAL